MLGILYAVHLQDYEAAAEYLEHAVRVDPSDGQANYHYGWLLAFKLNREYERARRHIARAVQNAPQDAQIQKTYADLFWEKMNDYPRARREYQKCLEQFSTQYTPQILAMIHCGYAGTLMIAGENTLAESHFRQALSLDPENEDISVMYAGCLQKNGKDLDKAEEYLFC